MEGRPLTTGSSPHPYSSISQPTRIFLTAQHGTVLRKPYTRVVCMLCHTISIQGAAMENCDYLLTSVNYL